MFLRQFAWKKLKNWFALTQFFAVYNMKNRFKKPFMYWILQRVGETGEEPKNVFCCQNHSISA